MSWTNYRVEWILYSEIKHSDWMLQVMWLVLANQTALLQSRAVPVWPDSAIFWTLGNFLKPLAKINLAQSSPFLGNYCKGVEIIHFSGETIFGQLLLTFGDFYLVILPTRYIKPWTISPLKQPTADQYCKTFFVVIHKSVKWTNK